MTVFDHKRLTNETLRLDVDGLRRGDYTDQYFKNVVAVLERAHESGYHYAGRRARALRADLAAADVGDQIVEAQIFTRRSPYALIAGVDVALAMLRYATGGWEGERFIETWDALDVEAVEDGVLTPYYGHPSDVRPAIKIRGRYRDFAVLETPMLGILSRASRVATNVYEVLKVCSDKPVLFFPARFDLPEVQAADGYAYWLAVQRHNAECDRPITPSVSTDAQGAWWGGRGGGTIPHALIAAYFGDTAEAMIAFAETMPLDVPRIALVDFNNDTVRDSLATAAAFWTRYRTAFEAGDSDAQRRWRLDGVRLDTSISVRDVSLGPNDPYGVNPKLVQVVRAALDRAWESWSVPAHLLDEAKAYCRTIKIVVTGGFNAERIAQFEREGVPVDIYGVGSTLLRNDSSVNTDFTLDVVRVYLQGQWHDVPKVGRMPNDNADLKPVDLGQF